MNILLVDDDVYVLKALQKSLDWNRIGIKNVYTAQSVSRAKKIIEDIPIQILICDIEMPKEDGFVLLDWLKQKNYIMKEILLTSYAEFKYASEAIRYGCYAYTLKPVDFDEMEKLIIGAMEEEKKALSMVNHKKYYEYWTASLKMRKEQFFWSLIVEHKQADMKQYDLEYSELQLFLPVMIRCYSGLASFDPYYKRGMFEWTLNTLITEVFSAGQAAVEAVLYLQKEDFLAVIRIEDPGDITELTENAAKLFLRKAEKKLSLSPSIIIGKTARLSKFGEVVATFIQGTSKLLLERGEIRKIDQYENPRIDYRTPDYAIWESFLKNGQYETVKQEIKRYLERQKSCGQLDQDILRKLIMDFIQILIAVLKEHGILVSQVGEPLFNSDLIDTSVQNITNATLGLGQMIDTVMNIINGKDKEESIVKTVKNYIDHNLDKEITREKLAAMVYLNQDYLARIFKKEIGISIGNYITEKRLEAAKKYLEKTNETVNVIAIRVGYDNFSYFTKIFKERVGMTPTEYRRKYLSDCFNEETYSDL